MTAAERVALSGSDNGTRALRLAFAKLALLGVVGLLCVGFLELGVRIARPQPASWLAIYQRHPRLPFHALQPNANALVDTGESRWDVHTDKNGFRVAAAPRPVKNLPLALVLGDSFAFGHGVRFEDSFVGLLERDPQRRFHFADAATAGYGPLQYAAVLDDLLDHGMQPQIVIVATFLGNDFHDVVWSKDLPVVDGVLSNDGSTQALLKMHSHLYRLCAAIFHRLAGRHRKEETSSRDLESPEQWRTGLLAKAEPRYREAMSRIAARCRERGIGLVYLLIPSQAMVDAVSRLGLPGDAELADPRLALVHAHRALDALGVPVVDPTPELARHETGQLYLHFDQHFTPLGHRQVASVLARQLAAQH